MQLKKVGPIIGLPWYTPEQYGEVRALMRDSETMPRNHAAWERSALDVEEQTRRLGGRVVRALIEPLPFEAWCRSTGIEMDARARIEYAGMIARKQREGKSEVG